VVPSFGVAGGWVLAAQPSRAGRCGPLVEKLAERFKDFSQVNDVFLDDPLSLRFAGLFAQARFVIGWFASVLFRVRHHVSRFSFVSAQMRVRRHIPRR
jgi:hypothetical protein